MRFEETNTFSASQLDFVPRDRRNYSSRLAGAFAVIVLFLCLLALFPDLLYAQLAVALFVAMLGIYVVIEAQRSVDLATNTEFMNLMFSQGLGTGASFCLFVRRDGTIVYANDGWKQLFGNLNSEAQALESVFQNGGVSAADRERMMGAIYSNVTERVIFPIKQAGEVKELILTVEPLPRPSGYVMIRGREYKGERTGAQMLPHMLRTTSPDKLDHMLAHTPIGHYATDVTGRFEYVNNAFEQILGFEPGELVYSRITLARALYQLGERAVSNDYTVGDYTGGAALQDKSGALINGLLFQTVIRDEAGRATGSSGSFLASAMLE